MAHIQDNRFVTSGCKNAFRQVQLTGLPSVGKMWSAKRAMTINPLPVKIWVKGLNGSTNLFQTPSPGHIEPRRKHLTCWAPLCVFVICFRWIEDVSWWFYASCCGQRLEHYRSSFFNCHIRRSRSKAIRHIRWCYWKMYIDCEGNAVLNVPLSSEWITYH